MSLLQEHLNDFGGEAHPLQVWMRSVTWMDITRVKIKNLLIQARDKYLFDVNYSMAEFLLQLSFPTPTKWDAGENTSYTISTVIKGDFTLNMMILREKILPGPGVEPISPVLRAGADPPALPRRIADT